MISPIGILRTQSSNSSCPLLKRVQCQITINLRLIIPDKIVPFNIINRQPCLVCKIKITANPLTHSFRNKLLSITKTIVTRRILFRGLKITQVTINPMSKFKNHIETQQVVKLTNKWQTIIKNNIKVTKIYTIQPLQDSKLTSSSKCLSLMRKNKIIKLKKINMQIMRKAATRTILPFKIMLAS